VIFEFLLPDPNVWDAVATVARAGYSASSLFAAGLGLFAAGFRHRLDTHENAALRTLALALVGLGIGLSVLAQVVRAAQLAGGEDVFDPAIWRAIETSRAGDAFYLRTAGLIGVAALATRWHAAPAIAAMGALLVAASYASMGHSTLYRPRQELSALVTLHLLAASFWLGGLAPLAWIARRTDTRAASMLIDDWSRLAMAAVATLFASGLLLAWYLAGSLAAIFASWWGWGLIAKLGAVAILLGMAARHKLVLAPALTANAPGAGARLARSIGWESLAALLVLYAASEMVSVHPLDYGHRIAS
jgi:copper resistance protein D